MDEASEAKQQKRAQKQKRRQEKADEEEALRERQRRLQEEEAKEAAVVASVVSRSSPPVKLKLDEFGLPQVQLPMPAVPGRQVPGGEARWRARLIANHNNPGTGTVPAALRQTESAPHGVLKHHQQNQNQNQEPNHAGAGGFAAQLLLEKERGKLIPPTELESVLLRLHLLVVHKETKAKLLGLFPKEKTRQGKGKAGRAGLGVDVGPHGSVSGS